MAANDGKFVWRIFGSIKDHKNLNTEDNEDCNPLEHRSTIIVGSMHNFKCNDSQHASYIILFFFHIFCICLFITSILP